jgi:hypothetical protein
MTLQTEILARFSGQAADSALYLPDLTLWYKWHRAKGTLPAKWQDHSLAQIARAMGVPVWLPVRPWRVETPGIVVETTEQDGGRTTRWETSAALLSARWTIGPDGDWWQSEHPVKTAEDLAAALEIAQSRTYVLEPSAMAHAEAEVGDSGVVVIELHRRPYSDLLHDFLGWSEGLFLLGEPLIQEILDALEASVEHLVDQVTQLPGHIVLSPDNLDGQFISPAAFQRHLAESYRRTAETLHRASKYVVVHVGGPIQHLLAPLAATGIDGLEGIAGPPQSDTSLAQARTVVGPELTLWGGIPQDLLLDTYDRQAFDAAAAQAAREAQGDGRMILGVADRVPVDASVDRLQPYR